MSTPLLVGDYSSFKSSANMSFDGFLVVVNLPSSGSNSSIPCTIDLSLLSGLLRVDVFVLGSALFPAMRLVNIAEKKSHSIQRIEKSNLLLNRVTHKVVTW